MSMQCGRQIHSVGRTLDRGGILASRDKDQGVHAGTP